MQTHIVASPELTARFNELLPALESINVSTLSIFPSARLGEPEYWLAYAGIDGQRNAFGTPGLRHLPLAEQAPNLREQLRAFVARFQR